MLETRAAPARRSRLGWTAVLLLALAVAAFAVIPYLTGPLDTLAAADVGIASTYAQAPALIQAALYLHIAGGATALVLGPLQFWRGLRAHLPGLHRLLGRIYLGAVAVGGAAGIVIAPSSSAGWVGFFGFTALGLLWLVTGWRAYRAIRAGDVRSHQAWMMRNFALTFAAVTLRLWLPLLIVLSVALGEGSAQAAFANAYAAVPFLAWLPNLIVAEMLIRRRGLPSYRLPVA